MPALRPSSAAALIAAALLLAPVAGRAAEVRVTWDPDLAFEWDRENYEKTLRGFVESSRAEVSGWLGLSLTGSLEVKVMTKARYEAQFGSDAAWSRGAHYQGGAIYVNGGARLDGAFEAMIVHEMTHAVLDYQGTARRLPTWLNEGLAERLRHREQGFEKLDYGQINELERALDQRSLLPLPTGSLSRWGYLQSFAAVLFLEGKVGKESLLAVVRRTLQRGTFEQALDAELRWTMRNVEEGFVYWVDHLQ